MLCRTRSSCDNRRSRHTERRVQRPRLLPLFSLKAANDCVALQRFHLGELSPGDRSAFRRKLIGVDKARALSRNGFEQNPPQLCYVARPWQPTQLPHRLRGESDHCAPEATRRAETGTSSSMSSILCRSAGTVTVWVKNGSSSARSSGEGVAQLWLLRSSRGPHAIAAPTAMGSSDLLVDRRPHRRAPTRNHRRSVASPGRRPNALQ